MYGVFSCFQEINIAYASGVLVLSFTHTGEPGYTLIIPAEYTLHIYRQLMKASYSIVWNLQIEPLSFWYMFYKTF